MIGRIVNNYEIQSLIGEGGQGSVYLAQHPFIGRKAAVKVMRRSFAEDDAMVARFMNEALAANAIDHPNIIDIIDVGRLDDNLPYLMMEHLDGETLGSRLRRAGKLSLEEALPIIEQTAAALGAAHTKGIVHRDLKPENLFLAKDPAGGPEQLKVLDFGIAKLLGDFGAHKVKTDGALFGTPTYMSPEQCRGVAGDADPRSDVYALGAIAFEMLCGAPPFVAEAAGDLLVMHISQPPPAPRSLTPALPEPLAAALERALAKDPAARFPTMEELWQAVHWSAPWVPAVLPHPPPGTPVPPAPLLAVALAERAWAAPSRSRWAAWALGWPWPQIAIVVGALLVAAAGLYSVRHRPLTAASGTPALAPANPAAAAGAEIVPIAPVDKSPAGPARPPRAVPAAPPGITKW